MPGFGLLLIEADGTSRCNYFLGFPLSPSLLWSKGEALPKWSSALIESYSLSKRCGKSSRVIVMTPGLFPAFGAGKARKLP
jgi:hypothetical protein